MRFPRRRAFKQFEIMDATIGFCASGRDVYANKDFNHNTHQQARVQVNTIRYPTRLFDFRVITSRSLK